MFFFVILFGLLPGTETARITAETPVDFSIHLCTHQRHHSHGHMQYLPQPVRFCVAMKSSKSQRDLVRDQQSTVSIKSNVLFTWRQVTSARHCRFGFKGYQGEYRLSPDFGAYEECQQVTSARHCRFGFKVSFKLISHEISSKRGYQGEYRLSPDFGAYEECQYSLSRHTHALSESLMGKNVGVGVKNVEQMFLHI
ncbi:unnamed protein product [Strongylus vulgaris]|uniref:CUB domain-containing protein n=1 Tax=Strongylus vulgaris TaxID=40348 RepID=A0A3P7JUB9_STRVU|nr:unnamed protein product [Strongylus vulgaris]